MYYEPLEDWEKWCKTKLDEFVREKERIQKFKRGSSRFEFRKKNFEEKVILWIDYATQNGPVEAICGALDFEAENDHNHILYFTESAFDVLNELDYV